MEEFPNPFGLTPSLIRSFGSGFIAWWYGALNNIPVGWALCNGENGTPDLRDKFIFGAGTTPVGNTGGSSQHVHDLTSAPHPANWDDAGSDILAGAGLARYGNTAVATATTDLSSSIPPYHALAYIMEL